MSPIRTFQGMYVNKNIPWNVKSDKILFFSVFLLPEVRTTFSCLQCFLDFIRINLVIWARSSIEALPFSCS